MPSSQAPRARASCSRVDNHRKQADVTRHMAGTPLRWNGRMVEGGCHSGALRSSGDQTAGTIASGLAGGTRHMHWYHQGTAYIQASASMPDQEACGSGEAQGRADSRLACQSGGRTASTSRRAKCKVNFCCVRA